MFGKITIYKAPVYRVFAEGVKLNNKGILIPDIKDETVSEEELFYLAYRAFVNINRAFNKHCLSISKVINTRVKI